MNEESVIKMKEIVKEGYKKNKVLHVSEAYRLYPVEEEPHEGKIEYWTQGEKTLKCEKGDIV